jgi:hypothetical protein
MTDDKLIGPEEVTLPSGDKVTIGRLNTDNPAAVREWEAFKERMGQEQGMTKIYALNVDLYFRTREDAEAWCDTRPDIPGTYGGFFPGKSLIRDMWLPKDIVK